MKSSGNSAQWANYPGKFVLHNPPIYLFMIFAESAVWMMLHVWDHFDYTNDIAWFKAQGWPLLKVGSIYCAY